MDYFSDFLDTVPGWARLLLAIAITVGVTLAFVTVFHERILTMDDDPDNPDEEEDEEASPNSDTSTTGNSGVAKADGSGVEAEGAEKKKPTEAPASFYLGGRVISLVGVAFVFIFAFCVNNFWTNNHDARTAVQNELSDITRITALAQSMGGPAGAQMLDAIATYRNSIIETEWPLMRQADVTAASQAHEKASMVVATAIQKAESEGAKSSVEWSSITKAIDDMISQGKDRTNYLPAPAAPGMVGFIFVLGITNLALTGAYQPARLGQNLFLMGVMAAITALMFFLVVEASNPYVGGGGIPSSIFAP